jgi:hypothetical protein
MMVAIATSATAGTPGINLSWNNCDTTPASADMDYACHGDLHQILRFQGTFRSVVSIPDFNGCTSVVDITWAGPVPSYWEIDYPGCNTGALSIMNPTAVAPCAAPNIFDNSFSGGGFSFDHTSLNKRRLRIDWATGTPSPPSVTAGALYPAFQLTFDPDQGVLQGCTGCDLPASLTLVSVEVAGFTAGEDYVITTTDVRNTITWQSGPTPVQNKTWGAIKALYR